MALKVTRAARVPTNVPAPGCIQLRCRRIKLDLNQLSKVAPSPVVTTRASGIEQPAVSRGLANASPTSTLESSVDEAVQNSSREALTRLGIAAVAPEDLFDQQHIQQWTPLLLAYLPFGCALALIRMAAWVGGIALDASWFRNRAVIDAYMALLGVTVKWEGEQHIPAQRHVLVSNHVSTADLLVLFQRPQRYIHLITSALPDKVYACNHLPALLQPASKPTYLALAEAQQTQQHVGGDQQQQPQHQQVALPGAQANYSSSSSSIATGSVVGSSHNPLLMQTNAPQHQQHEQHLQHVQAAAFGEGHNSSNSSSSGGGLNLGPVQHMSPGSTLSQQQGMVQQHQQQQQPSVHLFPEGGMTNGKGMMRFSRGFMLFADKLPVVPVALRVTGAFPQISSHTIDSNFLVNLFWCSFQPWTVIEARALPAMQLDPGESKAAFVQRVQLAIAEELGVWVADLSIQQKRQMAGSRAKKQLKQRVQ